MRQLVDKRSGKGWLWAVVAASALTRLAFCAWDGDMGRTPAVDYREYVTAARRLLAHGTFTSPLILDPAETRPSNLMPPAYAGVVALAYKLLGVESLAATNALKLLNIAAMSLIIWPVFLIGEALCGRRAAWIAALLTAGNPLLTFYCDLLWDTCLFALCATLCVWMSVRLAARREKPNRRAWIGMGLLMGGTAMINPALTLCYPVLVLRPALRHARGRAGVIASAVFFSMLGWAVMILPWTIRNYAHFDKVSYVRGGLMLEVWLGVCPEAEEGQIAVYRKHFPLLSPVELERATVLGEPAYVDACGVRAREAIRENPGRVMKLGALRFLDFWTGNLFAPGIESLSLAKSLSRWLMISETLIILSGGLLMPAVRREVGWLLLVFFLFTLIYSATHFMVRFRAPIEPLISVVLAATGVHLFALLWRKAPHTQESGGQRLPD